MAEHSAASKEHWEDARKVLEAIGIRIVGPDYERWLKLLTALKEIDAPTEDVLHFLKRRKQASVWRRLMLGDGPQSGFEFIEALRTAAFTVLRGGVVDAMLRDPNFFVSPEPKEVELVMLWPRELDFPSNPIEALSRAQERGYDPCPAEVGPQLRLQYADQPEDEWLAVGMAPLADPSGIGAPGVFTLECPLHKEISVLNYFGGDMFRAIGRFIFLRRNS